MMMKLSTTSNLAILPPPTLRQFNELQETNQIDVDLEKIKDEEDQDIAERFKV